MTRAETGTVTLARALCERALERAGVDRASDDFKVAVDGATRYATRVLASELGRRTNDAEDDDEGALGREIARRVARARGAASGTRAAEACERLRGDGSGLRRRSGILRCLMAISDDVKMASGTLERGIARAGGMVRLELDAKARALAREERARGTSAAPRASGETTSRALAGGDKGAMGLHAVGRRADAYRALEIENVTRGECDERDLVRDVLYACQGIDGEFVKFSPAEQAFVIAPNVNVSAGRRNLIKSLTEVGWLFKKVTSSLGDARTTGVDVETGEGSTRQAFQAAIQRELAEYYKLVAVLESQAQVPIIGFMPDGKDAPAAKGADAYLTLRRLFLWLADPLKTLRTLAILVDATYGHRGGAILAAIHKYSRHGDPSTTTLVRRILSASATPFLGMTQRWTVSGELDDPSREYFVRVDHAVPDKDLWRRKYEFDENMLPSFITQEQGRTIMRLGKSINFLRRCCDDSSWAPERAEILNEVEKAGGLDFENPDALAVLILETSKCIDGIVRRVLFERYKLGEHCQALKRYLLLGQGDLHESLMDLIGPSLDEPANSLSVFKLSGVLEQAVRSSSVQSDSSEFIDRLRVRLMPHLNEEIGWDVFTLEYVVNQPLTTIFTEHAMSKYLRVFNFLWRLKRVEHTLCGTWQMMKPTVSHMLTSEAAGGGPSGATLVAMLRDCHSLRGEMHSFMSNFQYYVMVEVLEVSWADLEEKFAKHSDLDEIIAAHEIFLDSVVQKALLGSKSQLVLQTLYALFEIMMSFREVAEGVFDIAAKVFEKKAATRERIAEREKNQQWGTYVGEESTSTDFIDKDELYATQGTLSRLRDDYSRALDGFLNLLPLQTHVDTQFLLFRLDFSDYYVARGIGPGDVSRRGESRQLIGA
ncbi:Gamma tubulin complex protein 3 [Ostreococcus tauri]|uniref:Gamma tubulin complex protein 3 n=1 Tax=Ostreococcus tauri TaxID=70448 RepID=A0A090M4P9_OSTTA|nr:Gamma tubulin complex protein 3 [Ostreococcus tauri]CEF97652.1 Gamma tubulin complex protein 3 [Ostreococcus tauri]|eukprot:XP_003078891.2 Gamma tubulin complex protein 3 [Ostreococcus tauri]